ncbi:MAG: helix-turn-helix domain-containing protein [Boseongicola sp.]|nr:MAG: helix-turn-helix domain-containing protein [Boseongicola sp.]
MRSYSRPVLIWFTRGQGRITIAGRSGGYSANSAVFLPAGTMHGFSVSHAVLGSVIHIPKESADLWPNEPRHLRVREVQLQRELTGMIDAIEQETHSNEADADLAQRYHAGLLAIWFGRKSDAIEAASSLPSTENAAHRLTQAYTALVERDFRYTVGVQHFAELLGVTPTHLSRACREASGRAALDFLTDRRHFEACRLLKDTGIPIAIVASRSGFASPAYFTRAFSARAGKSPSIFRRERSI